MEKPMISFYVPSDAYGCLSNFSPHGVSIDQVYWPTAEHFFQAQKFAGSEYAERIRCVRTPGEAKNLGLTRKIPIRPNWEEVKIDVMREAVLAKFTAHEDLRDRLLATGAQEIVENAPGDTFWGCGKFGNGQNWLGRILMECRSQLREQQ